jgi:CheY-like chemotaxis protein
VALVVEDDADARRAMEWMLDLGGYVPVGVGTASEALAYLLAGNRPAVILLDLGLPDVWGGDLLARLQAEPQLTDVPVVVQTGHHVAQGVPGAFATLLKGVPPDALIATVDAACGWSRARLL